MSTIETGVRIRDLRNELRKLEAQSAAEMALIQPLTEADERRMTDMQARADSAYIAANRRAPPPHAYERPDEYRRRLVDNLKIYSQKWAAADFISMDASVLPIVEKQVFADAVANGRTHGLKPYEIRQRVREDASGHRVVEYDGGPGAHYTRQFTRAPQLATFKSDAEYRAMSRDANMARISEIIRQRPVPQPMRTGF